MIVFSFNCKVQLQLSSDTKTNPAVAELFHVSDEIQLSILCLVLLPKEAWVKTGRALTLCQREAGEGRPYFTKWHTTLASVREADSPCVFCSYHTKHTKHIKHTQGAEPQPVETGPRFTHDSKILPQIPGWTGLRFREINNQHFSDVQSLSTIYLRDLNV